MEKHNSSKQRINTIETGIYSNRCTKPKISKKEG